MEGKGYRIDPATVLTIHVLFRLFLLEKNIENNPNPAVFVRNRIPRTDPDPSHNIMHPDSRAK